jgi:UDP-N-acetylmuramoyl-tripeptide--D-alanyl-D-alanine ligase
MKIEELYSLYKQNYKVTTDTRLNLKNSIFFALKGDNFNGNKYANHALKKGAKYAVVDQKKYQTSKQIILVKDVLQTLQELAKFHSSINFAFHGTQY